jgi:hypothetical protein
VGAVLEAVRAGKADTGAAVPEAPVLRLNLRALVAAPLYLTKNGRFLDLARFHCGKVGLNKQL